LPQEVAILYYLTLTRLTRLATFSDCLRVLKSVAGTYYAGDPAAMNEKRSAIEAAYGSVGIV
jgi:Zn-dependent metalloprotease